VDFKTPTIEFEGADELVSDFRSLSRELRGPIGRRAMSLSAELLVSVMKDNAPVGETGKLRDTIVSNVRNTSARVGPRAPYARFVEAKSPFVVPTYESQKGAVINIISSTIAAGVEAVA